MVLQYICTFRVGYRRRVRNKSRVGYMSRVGFKIRLDI